MEKYYWEKVLKSNYCRLVFLISTVIIYLFTPKHVLYGWFSIIGVLFMLTSALVITCLVRDIKDRIILAKNTKSTGLAMFATVIGLVALQTCSISAPVCGASIGAGILAIIIPGFSLNPNLSE